LVSVVPLSQADRLEDLLCGDDNRHIEVELQDALRVLSHRSRAAVAKGRKLASVPFEPECLTLYLHGHCNLSCSYCLRKPSESLEQILDVAVVRLAAGKVGENCVRKGKPLTAVFHGWGEPALDSNQLESLVEAVSEAALELGIQTNLIISTNGVIPERTAEYLGVTFNLVNLSCDGPPEIQDKQRPTAGGGGSSVILKRTASVIRKSPARLAVRATITPATLDRQEEIIDYIIRELHPDEVRFEPAYRQGNSGFSPDDALPYADSFFAARDIALSHGIRLTYSGARPTDIHGPYCNIFRDVLNLLPDGSATACFADADGKGNTDFTIAVLDGRDLRISEHRIAELQDRIENKPAKCKSCFNSYHCVGDCPERCILDSTAEAPEGDSFRCNLAGLMAERLILECAEKLTKVVAATGQPAWRTLDSDIT
jgi:radical SAM protein with 4Fe4S-binding SPASM domain